MSRGHSYIMNLSNYLPFVFTFNPTEVKSSKKIHYAIAPNIGGASKKRYFSGFDSKEISFNLRCVDMESPIGVTDEIAFFEQLREPDPGLFSGWFGGYGNENFPPPKVLFQFGVSIVPLVWDVLDVDIVSDHFTSGKVSGVFGFPKKCDVSIKLALDEEHFLNQANQVAKKAEMVAASAESIIREVLHQTKNTRKELPGIFSAQYNGWKDRPTYSGKGKPAGNW